MEKKKNKIAGVLVGVAAFMAVTASAAIFGGVQRKPSVYTVTYQAVISGEVQDVPEILWKAGGQYPTEYVSGAKDVAVDGLQKTVWIDEYHDYTFCGWYEDKALTKAFDGVIEKRTTGDVTLYAKVSYGTWTMWIDLEDVFSDEEVNEFM